MINVLLVDDEEHLLDLGKEFLADMEGFNIITASSVDMALGLVDKYSFDAIVSDYQMPGKDGIEFLIELRRRRDHIPFILFTGRGREEVVIEAINQGVDYYVKKDTDVSSQYAQLSHTIEQAVIKKQAIDAVEYNLNLFKELIENSLDIIIILDVDGRIEYISPSVKKVLGYTEKEAIGRRNRDFVRPEMYEFINDYHRKTILGVQSKLLLLDLRKRDGTWATMEIIAKLYEREGRKKVIVNARDVTDRVEKQKLLKAALSELEARNGIMDLKAKESDIGMITFIFEERKIILSPMASSMFGLGSEMCTIDANRLQTILHPDDINIWMNKAKYTSRSSEPQETRYRVRMPDGELRHHHALTGTSYGDDGTPKFIIGFINDITEMVRLHDRIRSIKGLD